MENSKGGVHLLIILIVVILITLSLAGYSLLLKGYPTSTSLIEQQNILPSETVERNLHKFDTFGNEFMVSLTTEWESIKDSTKIPEQIRKQTQMDDQNVSDGTFVNKNNDYKLGFLATKLSEEDMSIVKKELIGTDSFSEEFIRKSREALLEYNNNQYHVIETFFKDKPANEITVDYDENMLRSIQFVEDGILYMFDLHGPKNGFEIEWEKARVIFTKYTTY